MSNTVSTIDEFGATNSRFCAAVLGYSFQIDDYGTEILVPPSVATSRRANGASRDRKDGAGLRFAPSDIVTVLVANPKKPGNENYKRWQSGYLSGRTVAETVRLGVTLGDIRYDVARGFVRVDSVN